jgi:hypothetical protein
MRPGEALLLFANLLTFLMLAVPRLRSARYAALVATRRWRTPSARRPCSKAQANRQ